LPYDGPVHRSSDDFVQGYFHYWSGVDSSIFFDIPDGTFKLCRELFKGTKSVDSLSEEDEYKLSIAVEKKLLKRENGNLKLNYYYISKESRLILENIAYRFYDTAFPLLLKAYNIIAEEYSSTVPSHLHCQMNNFLTNPLSHFVNMSLYEGVKNGILSQPDEHNKSWLSLFASEQTAE